MTDYYVDTAVGNDSNAGTSEGSGNAWATIQKAADTVVAGDTVYIKASGNYNETVTETTNATFASPIVYEGYSSTTGDNGMITIDGQSTRTNCLVPPASAGIHMMFKNIRFTGATGDGASMASGVNYTFVNCRFDNNGGAGVGSFNTSDCHFINCQFDNNTGVGLNTNTNTGVALSEFFGNGGTAQLTINTMCDYFYRNIVYDPGGSQTILADLSNTNFCVGNIFDGANIGNITLCKIESDIDSMFVDNIFYDGDDAVLCGTSVTESALLFAYNLVNSMSGIAGVTDNGTDHITDFPMDHETVTSAPVFTDEAGGDYTPGDSSPVLDAGMPIGVTS